MGVGREVAGHWRFWSQPGGLGPAPLPKLSTRQGFSALPAAPAASSLIITRAVPISQVRTLLGTEETGSLVPCPVPPRDLALGSADGRAVVGPVLSESEPREPRLRPGQEGRRC